VLFADAEDSPEIYRRPKGRPLSFLFKIEKRSNSVMKNTMRLSYSRGPLQNTNKEGPPPPRFSHNPRYPPSKSDDNGSCHRYDQLENTIRLDSFIKSHLLQIV
jgi:hypothetical protein